jgi:ATP-binding cassette subfamily B multidrug efflux pump
MGVWKRNILLRGVSDTSMSPYKVWGLQFLENWGVYIGGCLAVIVTDFAEVFVPKLIADIVDFFSAQKTSPTSNDNLEVFYRSIWILLLVLGVQLITRIAWRLLLAQQSHYVSARMKNLLWEKLRFIPQNRIETDLSPGELMNVAAGDVSISRYLFGFTLVGTVDFVFLLTFCLFAMFSIDVGLTLMCLAIFPILPPLLHRLAKREGIQHQKAQNQLSQLTDLVAQNVSTVRLQKVTETSFFWEKRLKTAANDYRHSRTQVINTNYAFIPVTGLPPLIAYGILLYFGIQKLMLEQISIGEFVAMQSYIFIVQGPLFELGTLISEWQRGFASFKRYLNVLRQPEEPQLRSGGFSFDQQLKNGPVLKSFEIKNLQFKHDAQSDRLFFNGLSQSLKPGDRWGIFGPVGTGKSTLVAILAGLKKGYQGEILLNKQPLNTIEAKSLRKIISIVPQKPFLFASTIYENLCLDNPLAGETDIHRALEICSIYDEVQSFPQGIQTKLGEWGINLSGGQKQRLTLARALLRKPEILFLDDCLSAVDTVTEEKILKNLDLHFKDQILIWIAHRPSTLKYCHLKTELLNPQVISRGLSL